MTSVAMAARLPRTLARAVRLGWTVDRSAVLWLLVAQVASAALGAGALAATTGTLSALLSGGAVSARLHTAVPVLVVLVVALVGRASADAGAQASAARLAPKVTRWADLDVLRAATALELSAYEDPGWEDQLEAAGRGAEATRELVIDAQSLTSALAQMAAAASVLAVLDPVLVPLLVLAAVPRGLAAVRAARIEHASTHRMLSDTRLRSVLRSYTADRGPAAEVRASTMAPFLLDQYQEVAGRLESEDLRASRRALRTQLVGDGLAGLATAATWAALGALVATGSLPLAAAGTAVVAVRTSSSALTSLVRAGARLFRTSLYLDDWSRFLTTAQARRAVRGAAEVGKDGPDLIRAEGVTFTYPGASAPSLRGIDLELTRGEVVALVGPNGAGKSTLANILTGLYLADQGRVTWDGVDLAGVDPASLWSCVGIVPQAFTRWPMAMRENITLGQPRAGDDSAVHAAAESAGASSVVEALPNGLDTLLARSWWGGTDLSGGQWQRVAVSRAFYRNAPVLIMDEPTSALDARAESMVFARLRALAKGRTVLFVTHRLANVKAADRIIVLDAGQVAESGAFSDLVDAGGIFAELYKLQQDR
ncbi:ATP-binding cassette domain-containing protein [Streptacidiphilus sp. EB129]|uniref:ATP-binding cassette domain-containing protein n=1 Tax=Streptacidiphilus sp. EB129 TaxID=3156262 RepID=UPI003512607D